MENISNDKARYLSNRNFEICVTKGKDVLLPSTVRAKDILFKDKVVNNFSEIFPQSKRNNDKTDLF